MWQRSVSSWPSQRFSYHKRRSVLSSSHALGIPYKLLKIFQNPSSFASRKLHNVSYQFPCGKIAPCIRENQAFTQMTRYRMNAGLEDTNKTKTKSLEVVVTEQIYLLNVAYEIAENLGQKIADLYFMATIESSFLSLWQKMVWQLAFYLFQHVKGSSQSEPNPI